MLGGLALLLTLSSPAAAKDEPELIATGTTVRINGVGRKDAFWRFRDDLVGQVCVVGDPGLVRQSRGPFRDAYYSGALACPDDQGLYFYQVEIERGVFSDMVGGTIGHTLGDLGLEAPEAPPPAVPAGPELAVEDASPPSAWPVGARVRIRDLSVADANASRRAALVGQRCTVVEEALAPTGGAWVSGALRCDDGVDYFFFQVALDPGGDAPATASGAARTPSRKADGRLQGEPVPAGRMVRIVDVAPADRHHADRASLVGKTCSVIEGPLVPSVDSFYAGRLFCEGGASWQLYQVAVAPL
jgi:hypothetical protein